MPWRTTTEVLERTQFVLEAERGDWTISELSRRYGISRKTGYHWIRRYRAEGLRGLEDRSKRPHSNPTRIEQVLIDLLLAERRAHPHWGPRKLLARLARRYPEVGWPARSTAAAILKREGLVEPQRRGRRGRAHAGVGLGEAKAPNELWTCDFKGEFRLGSGSYCYPLTLQDAHSRYLLAVDGCGTTRTHEVRPIFERVFRTYGLPDRIGSDNGSPFASVAVHGLSRLSVWWIKLGITPQRIEAGHPEQNGRHERLHRTLKAEAIPRQPPCADQSSQQEEFDRFRVEYNDERPHEALADAYPTDVYRASWRPYSDETPGLDYPAHFEKRQIRHNGCMQWRGRFYFVSELLAGEPVGLEETEEDLWTIHFGPLVLGRLRNGDERIRKGAPSTRQRRTTSPPAPSD